MSVEIGQVLFSSPNNITVYIDDLIRPLAKVKTTSI